MFIKGFHKIAGVKEIARAVTRPIGIGRQVAEAVRKGSKKRLKSISEGISEGVQKNRFSPTGIPKKNIGEALSTKKYQHEVGGKILTPGQDAYAKKITHEGTQESVKERAKKMYNKKGPTWAARHPIITGLGTAAAFKGLTGDSQPQPGPTVYTGTAPSGMY